jgi:hypothetical protein
MAWYEDLSPCDYFGKELAPRLIAIGWLESGHPFRRGPVAEALYSRLAELLANPWQPMVSAGLHSCSLCRFDQPAGTANVFVPGRGFLYVAPQLVLHYIAAHEYSPPAEFEAAVLACPPMRSMDYLRAVRQSAPPGLLKGARPTV